MPFIPFMRSAVLYVPEGYRLRLVGNYYPWGHNATTFPLEEKYREVADNRGHFGCEDRVVWYSKEEKRFVCAVDGYELENLKRRYMQEYVLKHFDEFSPITHKEEYKRNYR
ncbi:MAG: hypothetical protein LBO09_03370 [Candidatus Peribacteria bacterium]|nr:hypothetical protein [Candidatus Peribacteria bacterium]